MLEIRRLWVTSRCVRGFSRHRAGQCSDHAVISAGFATSVAGARQRLVVHGRDTNHVAAGVGEGRWAVTTNPASSEAP
jgi:hypothetical protein